MKALNVMYALREAVSLSKNYPSDEILDEAIAELEEAMKPKTCSLCIFWDTARPRSHPNYAECNNRKCPLSYMEVHYEFGCKMFASEKILEVLK